MLVRAAAPAGATGTIFGFVYSGLDLGSAMTPPFLGFLLDHHLPRLIFVFTAGILILAISTAFVVGHHKAERRSGIERFLARSPNPVAAQLYRRVEAILVAHAGALWAKGDPASFSDLGRPDQH